MDSFYPTAKAAEKLEKTAVANEAAMAKRALNVQHLANAQLDQIMVRGVGDKGNVWILSTNAGEDQDINQIEEVIFRIQGVITHNNLIPKDLPFPGSRKIAYLAQHIEICGLETASFASAINKITEIRQKFAEHLFTATIFENIDRNGPFGIKFVANNRFFTKRHDAPTEQDTEFQHGVDPLGSLHKLKGSDLIHAPDNIVKYYKLVVKDDDSAQYVATIPGIFRDGDVVELQISFIAIQMRDNRVKITQRLQAVTLLSNAFTREAEIARMAAAPRPVAKPAVKRKTGYGKEDEDGFRMYKRQNGEQEDSPMHGQE